MEENMLRVLTLFALFFQMFANVNADFHRLSRNGQPAFFYSDDERGSNRNHILSALHSACDAIQAKKDMDSGDLVRIAAKATKQEWLFDLAERASRMVYDPFKWIMIETLKREGIGHKGGGVYDNDELNAWYLCAKKNNSDLQKGIQTDIGWILGGDPRKGITLYWHSGQQKWHIDRP